MIKSLRRMPSAVLTVVMLAGILVLISTAASTHLLAQPCSAGACDCECTSGSCAAGTITIPYTSIDYSMCQCTGEGEFEKCESFSF